MHLPTFISNSIGMAVKGAITFGLIAGVLAAALYTFQDNIMYIPDPDPKRMPKRTSLNPPRYNNPGEYDVKGDYVGTKKVKSPIVYEERLVKASDGVAIHVWLMLHENSNEVPTLIYFHGNAGNMGYRLPNSAKMFGITGVNVLMMDYRGFGESSGKPTEAGINLDADAVLEYAKSHPRLEGSPIILFGRSLGGAVAISLCHRRPEQVAVVIVENTFMSISAMVDSLMPWAAYFKHLVLRIDWNNYDKIKEIRKPVFFIGSEYDEIVPPMQMRSLFNAAVHAAAKDFYLVADCGHNNAWDVAGLQYYKRLKEFLIKSGVLTSREHVEPVAIVAPSAPLEPVAPTTVSPSGASEAQEPVHNSDETSLKSVDDSDEDYCKVSHEDVQEGESVPIPSLTNSALHRRLVNK